MTKIYTLKERKTEAQKKTDTSRGGNSERDKGICTDRFRDRDNAIETRTETQAVNDRLRYACRDTGRDRYRD